MITDGRAVTGAALKKNIGGNALKSRRERHLVASAEGGRIEAPNGVGYKEGCTLSSQLEGLGSLESSHIRVRSGARPETHFEDHRMLFLAPTGICRCFEFGKQCFVSHLGGGRGWRGAITSLPPPQRRTTHELLRLVQWYTVGKD